jgi:glycosyltransferase involved in cell wall biosynthesis
MRIIQLTPGAGDNFYCENCIRDQASLRQMRKLGLDILMVPLYLPPMRVDAGDQVESTPIFFGGINVYLQQKMGLFRRTPRWLDRLFDSQPLLRWASTKMGMTDTQELGQTTVSMLQGEHGRQVKEVDRLVEYLADQPPADAVLLSNVLLVGLAQALRDKLDCKVICGLQDEDAYLDSLPEPYAAQCWSLAAEACKKHVDGFISSSRWYADRMTSRLGLDPRRVRHVPDGVEAEVYQPASPNGDPPVIGFLSQMTTGKGLDVLVEALGILKQSSDHQRLELHVAGGMTKADEPYVEKIRRRIDQLDIAPAVRFFHEFDSSAKREFLSNLCILSVPARQPSASAIYALDAWASQVPVVLTESGVAVELVKDTGAGDLVAPDDPHALAEKLDALLRDPNRSAQLGQAGRDAVMERYNSARHAACKIDALRALLQETA